jgi:hypothetical protein
MNDALRAEFLVLAENLPGNASRAMVIREQGLGAIHPETQKVLKDYVAFLRLAGGDEEARALKDRKEPIQIPE